MDLDAIRAELRTFIRARDWEQFHTPKNLATAMMVEAAELNEIFQWLTPGQSEREQLSEDQIEHIGEELADVLIYCIQLADRLEVGLEAAIWDKFAKNARKYPADAARGRATRPKPDHSG